MAPGSVGAYFVSAEEGCLKNIVSEKRGMIDALQIDGISESINERMDRIMYNRVEDRRQLFATLNQQELQSLRNSQMRVFRRVVCRSTPPRIQNTDEYMDVKVFFYPKWEYKDCGREYGGGV